MQISAEPIGGTVGSARSGDHAEMIEALIRRPSAIKTDRIGGLVHDLHVERDHQDAANIQRRR